MRARVPVYSLLQSLQSFKGNLAVGHSAGVLWASPNQNQTSQPTIHVSDPKKSGRRTALCV